MSGSRWHYRGLDVRSVRGINIAAGDDQRRASDSCALKRPAAERREKACCLQWPFGRAVSTVGMPGLSPTEV
ncbi:MAG: hypothetical protein ACO3FE_22295, partial [Planctomycetaceae bacterium]